MSGESPATMPARPVDVELFLLGGHRKQLTLNEGSKELTDLFTALSNGGASGGFIQLPVRDGRAAFSFHVSQLVSVMTRPPVVIEAIVSNEKKHEDKSGCESEVLVPRRKKDVAGSRAGDRVILQVPGQADDLSLNLSAASIWELVDGKRSLASITSALEREFEMAEGSLRDDVKDTAQVLTEAGAIELIGN